MACGMAACSTSAPSGGAAAARGAAARRAAARRRGGAGGRSGRRAAARTTAQKTVAGSGAGSPDELPSAIETLKKENEALRARLSSAEVSTALNEAAAEAAAPSSPPVMVGGMAVSVGAPKKQPGSGLGVAAARNVVFVTSEAAPYSKTGGLGDVCGALPPELADRGHRVMVVVPRYANMAEVNKGTYANAEDTGVQQDIWAYGQNHAVRYYHEFRDGVDWVFVDHPVFCRPGNPYADEAGEAFDDNQFRFTLLSKAACEAPLVVPCGGVPYGDEVVFIANDWHAGLTPVLVAANYRPHGVYLNARTLFAIHNLSHQGVEPSTTFEGLGLDGYWYKALEWQFPEWARAHELDEGLAVNLLKGAIVTCDRLLTVSKGYAWEVTTPEGGWGLDKVIQEREFKFDGITNGIDTDEWNPAADENTFASYDHEDLSGKLQCKLALQRELGLQERLDVPLIGFIGRLDYQKGPDVIIDCFDRILRHNDVQLVMLGSGDTDMQVAMQAAENEYSEKFRGWVGFSVPTSHTITAGCDILLMPSRFEPCGLNQLYAMRYGTIPVVHATGGLRDTVQQFDGNANGGQGEGTGFSFGPLSDEGMIQSLFEAVDVFRHQPDQWERMQVRAMTQDLTWGRVAADYEQVFEWAMADEPFC